MINSLYVFSKDLPVVASEWNANFSAIDKSNTDCAAAIVDANSVIAFEDVIYLDYLQHSEKQRRVIHLPGFWNYCYCFTRNCEYYKSLATGEVLYIGIPDNFSSETRIAIRITDNRTLLPFSIGYSGNLKISYGEDDIF